MWLISYIFIHEFEKDLKIAARLILKEIGERTQATGLNRTISISQETIKMYALRKTNMG